MNNLFILHTQYNIIIGSAVVLQEFKDDCNDLIVYAEFKVSDEYKSRLESVFNHVFYLRESFCPLPEGIWMEEKQLWKEYRRFKKCDLANNKYDHVFISQDRPLDCLIVGFFQNKQECHVSDIEEDCYYSSRSEYNRLDFSLPQGKNIIHSLRRLVYGRNYLYNPKLFFYGFSSFFDDYYVIYPKYLRPQLKDRNTKAIEVNTNNLIKAINAIYGEKRTEYPQSAKYYLFFFDLLERYKNPKGIEAIVSQLAETSSRENATLLVKYHPREARKFALNGSVFEIPAIVPAEKLLCDLVGEKVNVYGNATTAIIVANKLGFNTNCIAKINGTDNIAMLEKFKEMGIAVPDTVNDMLK